MEFQVLGDVEARVDGQLIDLGHARQRCVLVSLLVNGPTAVVISAVSGTAGVGKTALALRWAHRVRGRFPDGQLYVNLRGYDPDQPFSAADALAGFLRALGVAGAEIPLEVEERAALYRSLLDGRRMLIVLDNAATVEQVRPLLPGTPSAVVLVTSRDSLGGSVARHGARRLVLDLLAPEDAVVLLGALIGGRVKAEPDAAAVLAAARSTVSIAQLVDELGDEQRRLELLDAGGDPRTAVRAVFSWSYQHLPADAARAFRLLGLHPGPELDPYAAAALTHTSVEQAQHHLDLLTRVNVVQASRSGRYGRHDLLRAYASQLAASEDSAKERRSALTRLFDHYLATAGAAMDTLVPAERHRRPRVSPTGTPAPLVGDPTAARAWLDAERVTLTVVCAHTAVHRNGDRGGEAYALDNLGVIDRWQGSYRQAAEHHQQALTLCREIGERPGEAKALNGIGETHHATGHPDQARRQHTAALALASQIGDRYEQARAHSGLGHHYHATGELDRAHLAALDRDTH